MIHKAQAEPCQAAPGITKDLKNIAAVKDQFEESPFLAACKKPPGLLKNRPKTGLLVRSIVEKDNQGKSSRELLKKVLSKVRKRILDTTNQIQNIQTCIPQNTPQCAELKNWVQKDLPQYVKEARYNLSLSQSQHEVKTWASLASKNINKDLDPLGSYKFNAWSPLTEEEASRASKQLSNYINEINKEAKIRVPNHQTCSKCVTRFSEEALLAVRFQHYQMYHQMLAELPIIQYLKGPNVSNSDLQSAFQSMNKNLKQESEQLDKYDKLLASKDALPSEVLKILNYSSELEEVLLEDDKYCGLAASLVYTMSNRQLGNSIAIGLPILAVSIFAAPVILAVGGTAALGAGVGIGFGAVAGGAIAYQSYSDFKDTQVKTLGYIYGDSLHSESRSLEETYARAKYDAITLPVGFGLGGMIVRSLSVGTKSILTSRKVFESLSATSKNN